MKRTMQVIGLGAAGLGAAWLAVPRAEHAAAPQAQAQALVVATAKPSAPPAHRAPGCVFSLGDRLAYDVRFETRATIDLANSGLAANDRPLPAVDFNAALSGRLEMQAISKTEAGAVFWARTVGLTGDASLHAEEMNQPFLFEVAPSCALTRFAWSNAAVLRGARAQQALLWETNWLDPALGGSTLSTRNGTGAYVATVTRAEDDAGPLIERTHSRYDTLWKRRPEGFSARNTLRVQLGAGPWHDRLELQETQSGEEQVLTVSLKMSRAANLDSALVGEVDLSAFTWGDLLPRDFSRRDTRVVNKFDRALRAQVAPLSREQAIATLTESVQKQEGIERQWPPLAAWLEVHPEHTAAVIEEISAERLPEAALNAFFIAVGNARTTEARDALFELKRSSAAPTAIRVRAMFSLVDRSDVDMTYANELVRDAQSLMASDSATGRYMGNEALLAVTTMAGLRQDPAIVEVATEGVKSMMAAAQGHPKLGRVALKALANLGDASLLPLVQAPATAADRATREAAAQAFRRMQPQDSNPMVLAWLARENDVIVRRALYRTLESQHFDLKATASEDIVRQVLKDLPKETSLLSRKAMVRLLGRAARHDSPEVREALKHQARIESKLNTGLLNEIAEWLTPDEVREVLQ